ncbi:YqiA/YcfP family alpha/beta fold hydrolase [Chitinimonas sp.]|uniref:YqiA/YcfP family alpha/beta fold hydrolase n=1 Tax=Chitinimonas sp. TaxID=1934313 RepID=UPI0035ADAB9E
MKQLLYLHGFNSSPASIKARQTGEWLAARGLQDHFVCPALPYSPAAAAALIEQLFARLDPADTTVVGSSLGGFYASWVAERFGCQAALINPAVRPQRLLIDYLGPQRNMYSGETYVLERHHMAELASLEPPAITPQRYWLLVETGDETLDYRDAVAYYAGCRQTVIEGGDHSLQSWTLLLPQVMAWAGLVA